MARPTKEQAAAREAIINRVVAQWCGRRRPEQVDLALLLARGLNLEEESGYRVARNALLKRAEELLRLDPETRLRVFNARALLRWVAEEEALAARRRGKGDRRRAA